MRLLVTRPDEDAKLLAQALKSRGHKAIVEAVMTIKDVAVPDLTLTKTQALLITSANGIRALARAHEEREILVCAVGEASAKTARDLGFKKVISANGDVETLALMVKKKLDPSNGALLHIAGSYQAGDLANMLTGANFKIRRTVLYEAQEVLKLGPQTKTALKNNAIDGVLFFSPRTARLFCRLVTEAKLLKQCESLTAYCLSTAVLSEATELTWSNIIVAKKPNSKALLNALDQPASNKLKSDKHGT